MPKFETEIQAVFFDAAGTLIHLAEPVGETYSKVAARHGFALDPTATEKAFRSKWKAMPPLGSPLGAEADRTEKNWWRTLVDQVLAEVCESTDQPRPESPLLADRSPGTVSKSQQSPAQSDSGDTQSPLSDNSARPTPESTQSPAQSDSRDTHSSLSDGSARPTPESTQSPGQQAPGGTHSLLPTKSALPISNSAPSPASDRSPRTSPENPQPPISADQIDSSAYFEELFESYADPAAWKVYPEAGEVLSQLATQGKRLFVLSNFDSRLIPVLEGHGLADRFEQIIYSSATGHAKPSPEIFRYASKAANLPPERCLHVGDDPIADWQGAASAGFQFYQLDRKTTDLRPILAQIPA